MFRSTDEARFDGPCQSTGGSFGFRETATEVAAPINCRSLRRTSTTVSSVFLATPAQGLQLDIARRLRTASVVV